MFTITNRKFYDNFTDLAGGGIDTINGCMGDKITCIMEGYFYRALTNVNLSFTAATKVIAITSKLDTRTFTQLGFLVGSSINVVGSASNDNTFTIVSVFDKYLVVAEALTDESINQINLYDSTLVTAMDFYFNLIENSESENYVSKTDKGTLQKYTLSGLDAGDATPKYMLVGTDSYGWITEVLSGTGGNVSQVKVEGQTIVDYKQKFKITQVFQMAPVWSSDLLLNFQKRQAPSYFINGARLKHIARFDGRYSENDPFIAHSGSITQSGGLSSWFNQNSVGNRPDYSVVSIAYEDNAMAEAFDSILATAVTKVTIVINSAAGKFVDVTSKFNISILQCPLDSAELVNTLTTLQQNVRLDTKLMAIGDSPANGVNYGTAYQSLTDINIVFDSANQVTITFLVDYSTDIQDWISTKSSSDRNYAIFVEAQDIGIVTTTGIDRTRLICDFNSNDFDTREEDNFELVDYFHGFPYPETTQNEINDVRGFEGDFFYEVIPFRIETDPTDGINPTLKNIKLEIVATKSQENDFVLEQKIFDTSNMRKLNGIEDIDIEDTRNFILPDDSIWNRANLVRNSSNDSGTMKAYELQYGFVLRYEYWREVIQAANGSTIDVFKNIQNVNEAWAKYASGNNWALKLRMTAIVTGYNGLDTTFQAETAITILTKDNAPQSGPTFVTTLQYFDVDGNELDGILQNGPTRILAKFVGDITSFPAGMTSFYGTMFADDETIGSIFNRRFASSELDSEIDSPFSTESLPANQATLSYYSNALRFSKFGNRIELDTWLTLSDSFNPANPFIQPRLGYSKTDLQAYLLQENGAPLLQENGSKILY